MAEGLLYKSLIKQVRALDSSGGRDLLKRYLAGVQQVADDTAARIQDLKDTDRAATCRADLLQHLLWMVGFTPEYASIYEDLDERMLRKLIRLAPPLWRKRGTTEGLKAIIWALTGRSTLYTDWFDYRTLVGESNIGELENGSNAIASEYDSTIHMVDDGTLDAQLVADLARLFRPANETLEVIILGFLDMFDGETLDRWTGTGISLNSVDKTLVIGNSYTETRPVMAVKNRSFIHQFKFKWNGAAADAWFRAKFCIQGSGVTERSYYVSLNQQSFTTGAVVSLSHIDAGVPVGIGQVVLPVRLERSTWHAVRVDVSYFQTNPSSQETNANIKVYLDNDLLLDVNDVQGVANAFYGPFEYYTINPTGTTEVDSVSHAYTPIRVANISPTGETYSSTFISG